MTLSRRDGSQRVLVGQCALHLRLDKTVQVDLRSACEIYPIRRISNEVSPLLSDVPNVTSGNFIANFHNLLRISDLGKIKGDFRTGRGTSLGIRLIV